MARRQLTTEERERIKILLAEGLSYSAIGRTLGRDHKTIAKVATEPGMALAVLNKKKELADEYEELARRMLTSIKDSDIDRISAYQRTLSAAVSTDKMRLLRDQSTDNVAALIEFHDYIEERAKKLQALLNALRAKDVIDVQD